MRIYNVGLSLAALSVGATAPALANKKPQMTAQRPGV